MSELKRPSRLTELLRPRKAEAMWAALEEAEEAHEIEIWHAEEAEREEQAKDRAYDEYLADWQSGMEKGNPPDSRMLDEEIEHFARHYPEISEQEREQTGGWHEDHPGWTFTAWAESRGWDPEYVAEINAEFPPDKAEAEYVRQRDEREAEREALRLGELRIIPDRRLSGDAARIPDPYGDWTPWTQYWPDREASG